MNKPLLTDDDWDRIYREKFEDPTYYADRSPQPQSSLRGAVPPDLRGTWIPDGQGGVDPDRFRRLMSEDCTIRIVLCRARQVRYSRIISDAKRARG